MQELCRQGGVGSSDWHEMERIYDKILSESDLQVSLSGFLLTFVTAAALVADIRSIGRFTAEKCLMHLPASISSCAQLVLFVTTA